MSKGWRHHTSRGVDGFIHVWPEDDLHPHKLEGLACDCNPFVNDLNMVMHHSYDKREQFERNRKNDDH